MNRRAVLKFMSLSALATNVPEICRSQVSSVAVPPSANPSMAAFNQVGYLPAAGKVATIPFTASGHSDFHIRQLNPASGHHNQVAFSGKLSGPIQDEASGDRIVIADFSTLKVPGLYRIETHGYQSQPFQISKDAYRDPLRLSMRAFYGQRCGCAVDLGGGYSHPACHLIGAYHPSSGRSGPVPANGGWHDAGDYGRYVVNSGISTATLLWAWELYPKAVRNLSLDIPESGGKIPDFLAEIKWNLDWMLSLQDDDGGVWHKQTSEQFCAFIMPEQDALTSYVIGTGSTPYKSTCATADLGGVAAIAARCFAPYDEAYAARCLVASKRALVWAVDHSKVPFKNPPGVSTGEYGDSHCDDDILWAAAELFRTTHDPLYEQAFLAASTVLPPENNIKDPSWPFLAPMAYWTYLLADPVSGEKSATSEALKERIRKETKRQADTLIARSKASGYGCTLAPTDYIWGSNSVAANQSLLLLIADRFEPNPTAVEAALGNLHYLLGRNCFAVSWVTHVGSNPFQHPHHRPSGADNIAAPWPGMLSGGPNRHPGDAAAAKVPKQAPMHMWVDEQAAYSMNEIAINWNAPLVFLLAAANSLSA